MLGPHQGFGKQGLPSDDPLSSVCFAAFSDDEEVVGTSQVMLEDPPFGATDIGVEITPAWRLRGMATREDLRGAGLGTALLDRVIDYVAGQGAAVLWCNARLAAVNLYLRAGLRTYGDPWQERNIGPHIVMWRPVAGTAP